MVYYFVCFACLICAAMLAGFMLGAIHGKDLAYKEQAEKFPHVVNLQPTLLPAKYGDLMLIGTQEHPCEEPPCVDMWNGKTWVKLVPEPGTRKINIIEAEAVRGVLPKEPRGESGSDNRVTIKLKDQ